MNPRLQLLGPAALRWSTLAAAGLRLAACLLVGPFIGQNAQAQGLFERLGFGKAKSEESPISSTATARSLPNITGLSEAQIASGLKAALSNGVTSAVSRLGAADGFLKDAAVRIAMPDSLKKVEKTLRSLKQEALADEFVITMNRAAEKAVPEAAALDLVLNLLVNASGARLFCDLLYDRKETGLEIGGAAATEVFCGRVVCAEEDSFGIV